MIPREIPSEIQQIEIRTKRTATESLKGFSFQSPPQHDRVSRTVEHSRHADKIRLDAEKDVIFLKGLNRGSTDLSASQWKSFRVLQDALEGGVDFGLKPVAQTRLALLIPSHGVLKFKPRFPVEDYLAAHFRFLSLSGSSAQTCSHGIPLSGSRLNRSARRSASSICSGNRPSSNSPNSSRIWPVTSRRSFSGKRRICSKISIALMPSFYLGRVQLQADSYAGVNSLFVDRFVKLHTRGGVENERKSHFQPKRLLRSASTCSQGIPARGFFSKSARRRSSSADCSGVKSGSHPLPAMSSHKPWAISIRSLSGSAFAAARISAALILQNYSRFTRRQGAIIRHQRLKRLCPQITQIDADKECSFPFAFILPTNCLVNIHPRATPFSIRNPQSAIRNSHDPARNP